MPTNAYEIARRHATGEIAEINAQIEKLIHRKELIAKLLELFEQLAPQSALSDTAAPADEAPAEAPVPEVAELELPELQTVAQGTPN